MEQSWLRTKCQALQKITLCGIVTRSDAGIGWYSNRCSEHSCIWFYFIVSVRCINHPVPSVWCYCCFLPYTLVLDSHYLRKVQHKLLSSSIKCEMCVCVCVRCSHCKSIQIKQLRVSFHISPECRSKFPVQSELKLSLQQKHIIKKRSKLLQTPSPAPHRTQAEHCERSNQCFSLKIKRTTII